ncbi:unnamed protein product [Closterium sp. NIES-53]
MAGVQYSTASYLMHVIKGLTSSYNLLKRLSLAPMNYIAPVKQGGQPGQREQSGGGGSSGWKLTKDANKEKSGKDSGRGGGSRRRECWLCGDPDHPFFECPKRSDSDDEDPKGGRGRPGSRRPHRVKNQLCKEKQSTKSSTLAKDADSFAGDKGRDDKEASCSLVGVVEPTVSLVSEAGEDFHVMAAAVQANPEVVLLDSGCSHHLMGTKATFVDLGPTNLLSAGQLKENGVKLQEDGDGIMLVSAAGDVLGRASYTGRVLCIDVRPCSAKSTTPTTEFVALRAIVPVTKSTPDRLHARLAHLARHTFLDQGSDADDVLAVVHVDMCGSFRVAAKDGSLYFLLLKDCKTRYVWVRPVAKKSDALQEFVQRLAVTERQTKKSVLMLRSDRGGEFLGKQLTDFVNAKGIVHDLACPYTSQQNGMAECEMRTVVESVQTMLLHMGVQHHWWHLTLRQAVWVRNCLEWSTLQPGTTPYQLLTGKKPDLSLARVWGCMAQFLVPEQQRGGKMKPKARWGLHLGVSEESKGWELLNIADNRVVTTSDMVFYENMSLVGDDSDDGGEAKESTDSDEVEVHGRPRRTGRLRRPPDFFVPTTFTTVYDVDADDLAYEDAQDDDEEFPELDPDMHADPEHRWDISTMTVKELVERPPGVNIMKNRWVPTTKYHIDDTVEREKARLVVKGFMQVYGTDYDETYAPVSSYVTLRIFLSTVAILDLNLMQLDMKNAFLQSKLDWVLYMYQPDYFNDRTGRVCKLLKSLYELKQTPLLWYKALNDVLIGAGWKQSPLLWYTALNFKVGVGKELKELEAAFKLREISPVQKYLGLEIVHDRSARKLWLHQQGYVDKLRRRFLNEEQTGHTPKTLVSVDAYAELTFNDEEVQERQEEEYRQKVSSLQFAVTTTRPDIAFACSKLGSGLTVRSDQHWREVDRYLAYLANTRDTALEFGGGAESLKLVSHVDANVVGDRQNRTSTGGYVFIFGGAAVSWLSQRIKCATVSSTESGYVAATEAGKEGRRFRFLLAEFWQLDAETPTVLWVDKKSAITVAEGMGLMGKLKHMERQQAWLQHMVKRGKFSLRYIPIAEQPADFLTKALHYSAFNRCSVSISQVRLVDVGDGDNDVQGERALGTDVLEDRPEGFECLAAAVPRFASMLLPPEGDLDAPDIPTPLSYAEAIMGPYSSQWQAAMDAKMASWKVKRPPGSPPAFKARYVAGGFSQRQGVDYFHTFSPTPKMTTLRVLLHVAAKCDYELHSLDCSTAFLQRSLHEEIWLRRPPGFTGSFPAVEDLVSHLHASDARYRAAVPAEFLDRNPPPPPRCSARGTPRRPFFEGCSPSPLAPSYASAAAADVSVPEDVWAGSASAKRRSSKGKGGRGGGGGSDGGGGGSGSGGGVSSGGGGGGGSGGGSGGSGGGGGGSGGSGGSGGGGTGGGGTSARRVGSGGGQRQQQQRRSETLSPQQLREWFLRGPSGGSCPYVIRTGDRAGQTCGRLHTQHRSFSRLDDAWRAEFGDDVEFPRWADMLKSRIAIFDLDFDAIIFAMYALSVSAEGDCYWCVLLVSSERLQHRTVLALSCAVRSERIKLMAGGCEWLSGQQRHE